MICYLCCQVVCAFSCPSGVALGRCSWSPVQLASCMLSVCFTVSRKYSTGKQDGNDDGMRMQATLRSLDFSVFLVLAWITWRQSINHLVWKSLFLQVRSFCRKDKWTRSSSRSVQTAFALLTQYLSASARIMVLWKTSLLFQSLDASLSVRALSWSTRESSFHIQFYTSSRLHPPSRCFGATH